jgi:hypothetical protein
MRKHEYLISYAISIALIIYAFIELSKIIK